MQPKYQIFISSTYEDLKEEREQVIKAILKLGHIPIGMEMFNGANDTQWALIQRRIEESDYYIVVIAQRYGSTEPISGLSYTEKEYDYATAQGIPTIGFVISNEALWPGNRKEPDNLKQDSLNNFIAKIQSKMVEYWSNKDELAFKITTSLTDCFAAYPRTGWIRADQAASPDLANEISRLSKENSELRNQLKDSQSSISLLPQIKANLSLVFDKREWEPVEVSRNGRGVAQYQDTSHEGYWYCIEIMNEGTATTSIDLIFELDKNTTIEQYIKALNDNPHTLRERRQNWVAYAEINDKYRLISIFNDFKPGMRYSLFLPATRKLANPIYNNTEFHLTVHPAQGFFVDLYFKLRELELPELPSS